MPPDLAYQGHGPVSDEAAPRYFSESTGRWKIPRAYRYWREDQRDAKIATLVSILFEDAAHRGDRGHR